MTPRTPRPYYSRSQTMATMSKLLSVTSWHALLVQITLPVCCRCGFESWLLRSFLQQTKPSFQQFYTFFLTGTSGINPNKSLPSAAMFFSSNLFVAENAEAQNGSLNGEKLGDCEKHVPCEDLLSGSNNEMAIMGVIIVVLLIVLTLLYSLISTCYFCKNSHRLQTFETLSPGNEIKFPRCVYAHHACVYAHHAIVETVEIDEHDPNKAYLTLIEYTNGGIAAITGTSLSSCCSLFWKPKAVIKKKRVLYDLSRDNIHRVTYKAKTNSVEQVLQNAKSNIGKRDFNIIFENCKHFAFHCMFSKTEFGNACSNNTNQVQKSRGDELEGYTLINLALAIGESPFFCPYSLPFLIVFVTALSLGVACVLKLYALYQIEKKGDICRFWCRRQLIHLVSRLCVIITTTCLITGLCAAFNYFLPTCAVTCTVIVLLFSVVQLLLTYKQNMIADFLQKRVKDTV